jgi:hypothetical protein
MKTEMCLNPPLFWDRVSAFVHSRNADGVARSRMIRVIAPLGVSELLPVLLFRVEPKLAAWVYCLCYTIACRKQYQESTLNNSHLQPCQSVACDHSLKRSLRHLGRKTFSYLYHALYPFDHRSFRMLRTLRLRAFYTRVTVLD